jgi:2-polyprenyl-3-methyl-5-hydroxy-6-metoxy-1,4-benzoquinol methylase
MPPRDEKSASNSGITDSAYWEEHWQSHVSSKRVHPWDGTWGKHGVFLQILKDHLGSLSGKRAVELGGGNSKRLLSMSLYGGCRATAVDFAKSGLDATESLFKLHGLQLDCVQADMFRFAPAQGFDVVTHWGVLEHFTHPEEVMRVSARLLSPGGKVIFSMPNMRSLGARLWKAYAPSNWEKHIYHSDAVVSEACENAGLKLTRAFCWNIPLIQIAPWDKPTPPLQVITMLNLAAYGIGRVLPIYRWGHPAISLERTFVAELRQ